LPIEVNAPGYSPEQMALGAIVDQPVPRICAALRIDPMVLGYASPSKTYANMKQAMEGAYELTLIPLHSAIDSQMTEQIMPDVLGARDGDFFGRDYGEVRCLTEDADAKYKRLTAATGGAFLSVNEAREELGFPPIEGGDELRQPMQPGSANEREEENTPLRRAASLSTVKEEIVTKWRQRARVREEEKLALIEGRAGTNGEY
jgi:hypothetical protein